jgi:transposase
MIEAEKRKAIFLLHQEGLSQGEIARLMNVSRSTVQAIIEQHGEMPHRVRSDKIRIDPELLKRLYADCQGYAQRVYEKLVEEEGIAVRYSTVTRMLRELGISVPQKQRCDEVPDQPGQEMQHDTSPYNVKIGPALVRLVASLLYLRYSKRRYLKFYRAFNRFKMKCFFHEALMFWGYAAPRCIIDNTNLARLRGIGKNAVMVPQMAAFGKQYGFEFVCHERGHANRKAGEEKGLHTVETNFLPGRTFTSLEDMNAQAFAWATDRMYHKRLGKTRVIPAEAFEHERSYLVKLSAHIPEPYLVHERGTDQYGYAPFRGNFYWVPGTKRDDIMVIEYADRLKIYLRRECLTQYRLPPDGVTNKKFSPKGLPKPRYEPQNRKKPTEQEEKRLRAVGASVSAYLDFALKPKGIERHRFVRELFALMRQMNSALFIKTVERGLRYQITSVQTLKRIAVLLMNEGSATLPFVDVDERYRQRDAYQEGYLTDAPDFSAYDKMLEEEDDDDG